MAESVQIMRVANRAVVALKSWAPRLNSPATGGATSLPFPNESQENISPFPGELPEGWASLVPPGLSGEVRLLHLGPGEWLVVSDVIGGRSLHDRLRCYLERQYVAAVDLSCALKPLRVEGSAARDLLSKGCGLDLHPNSFPAGRTSRTRFAQLAVVIDCTDPKPLFDLYVGRSYLSWVQLWLTDAALEFA